jgi:hypothetical protein
MPELKTSLKIGSMRWVLTGVGGGAGLAIGLAAFRAIQARPEFLPQLVNGGFLGFAAVVVGMMVASSKADKFMDRFMGAYERQNKNGELLAVNVGALVSNQSQERRETDLLVNHMARTHDKISEQYGEILGRLDELKGMQNVKRAPLAGAQE